MREILFRGKKTNNEEWAYGFYQEYPKGYVHIQNDSNDWFPVIPETVCQYTGLTDGENRKIFEGDIISAKDNVIGIKRIGKIFYDDNDVSFKVLLKNPIRMSPREEITILHIFEYTATLWLVIGNIFDNPELIGDQP